MSNHNQKQKSEVVKHYITGFCYEIPFAITRLLGTHGVKYEEKMVESFMGMVSATRILKLNKGGKPLEGIYGEFKLPKGNPWEIEEVEIEIDSRKGGHIKILGRNNIQSNVFTQELIREVAESSIFKGSSFSLGSGVEFFKTSPFKPIFSPGLERTMNYSLYAPLRFHDKVQNFRRGVLLSGAYGTGKSSTAAYLADLANSLGITFIYIKNPEHFSSSIQFFSALGKCVIFVEDIDRLFEGQRNKEVDKMLNTLDGIDSKDEQAMFVFTTNNVKSIERALLRPGRIDSVVEMELPNLDASKLILGKHLGEYGNDLVVSQFLQDSKGLLPCAPAVLKEVATRAIMDSLCTGTPISHLMLLDAADSIIAQVQLIDSVPEREEPKLDKVMADVVYKAVRR